MHDFAEKMVLSAGLLWVRNLGCVTFTVQQTIEIGRLGQLVVFIGLRFRFQSTTYCFTSCLETCEMLNKDYAWFNTYFKPTLG